MQHVAIAIALACPFGAVAGDPAIGGDSGSRRITAARWTDIHAEANPVSRAQLQDPGPVARARMSSADVASSSVYRYGQRDPELEELPMNGRPPAIPGHHR